VVRGGCGGGWGYGGHAGGGYGSMEGYALNGYSEVLGSQEASLVVNLPADATLTVDGEATTSTSSTRYFRTPSLDVGKDYHYTLKAKVTRDGKVETVTRRVLVRAGEETRVNLDLPTTAAAE
jgi:uncharacterized protein (TIGR03000 family)